MAERVRMWTSKSVKVSLSASRKTRRRVILAAKRPAGRWRRCQRELVQVYNRVAPLRFLLAYRDQNGH